jgi:uncharacterized protein (TIRG00374 family)
MNRILRGRLPGLLKATLTLALVALLLRRISLTEALALIGGASLAPLLAALLLFALSTLAGAWQWGRFLAAMGIELPLLKLLEFYWVGLFFNNFLPSTVGGDVVKVLDLSRAQRDPLASATATLADRLTGLSALALLALIAAWNMRGDPDLRTLAVAVLWGSLTFLALGLLFVASPLASLLRRAATALGLLPAEGFRAKVIGHLRLIRSRRSLIVGLFFYSLLIQSLRVSVHYLVSRSLLGEAAPNFFDFFLVIPPLAFLLTLPITLGGLGLRESAALSLFAPLGVAGEEAVAIEVLAYLVMIAVSLQGGVLFFLRKQGRAEAGGS